ncbi:hypothetical protein ABZZ16_09280 [Streptomyces sp. NPDC006386]|uniref:hypothetical protein n=1 Tax=unclassified Streptomyces TaxID=2593676 RepID=UPI0033BE592B
MTAPTVRRHQPGARWREITSHDRDNHTLTVFSEPKDGRYQQISPYPWGATVELPAPVNITLDTEKLKDYAD